MDIAYSGIEARLRKPNEADWSWIRPIIEQEYKHAGRTRQEVCAMLSTQFGIAITENMFKKRISQWQLDKKRKRKEMVYAVKQIRGRQALGKATVVFIRNEEVSQWDITRYFKRRPLTASEQHQRHDGSPAPSDVIAKTPVLQACTPAAVRIAPQFSHPNAITEDKTTDVEREVYSAQAMALQDEKARHLSVPDAFLAYHEQPVPQCFAYQLEPHEEFLGWFYCYDECSFGKSSRWEDLIWALCIHQSAM
ncbi:hypothetical protein PMZ80_003994 [Knufia obscura]|uniref:Clr5 domain-containing protein n=1 Tax=Knufia obscura TaxID=1635080 RepID=A0ABR0RQT1_9EURO|nr:hypothetical protein PMZ80_003994 [Knufia obscura]